MPCIQWDVPCAVTGISRYKLQENFVHLERNLVLFVRTISSIAALQESVSYDQLRLFRQAKIPLCSGCAVNGKPLSLINKILDTYG